MVGRTSVLELREVEANSLRVYSITSSILYVCSWAIIYVEHRVTSCHFTRFSTFKARPLHDHHIRL